MFAVAVRFNFCGETARVGLKEEKTGRGNKASSRPCGEAIFPNGLGTPQPRSLCVCLCPCVRPSARDAARRNQIIGKGTRGVLQRPLREHLFREEEGRASWQRGMGTNESERGNEMKRTVFILLVEKERFGLTVAISGVHPPPRGRRNGSGIQ